MNNLLQTENKIDSLLILRGFACLCVVLSHVSGNFSSNANIISLFGYNITWLIKTPGSIGVWIFFILSGYLMGKGFYTGRYTPTVKSSLKFYWNRFLRIYPLYIFSIFVVCIFFHNSFPLMNLINLNTLLNLLRFNYSLQSFFPNGLLWTI